MKRIVIILILAVAIAGVAWWFLHNRNGSGELRLYGNVDFRQVDIAFNGSERVAEVLVEEGDRIKKDQVLARLDTSRPRPQVAQAEAQAASQRANVARLKNGSRPEDIAQARANLESAKVEAANARAQYERQSSLALRAVASQRSLEMAASKSKQAEAKVEVNQKALDLLVIGPRIEDIEEAEAQLRAADANVALLHQ
ncbi:biotin/lipoyl-binding protein [Rhizobium sp. IBUN]|uniref:biotin/lipoyl-binding protein n=1 Tax=Rhizobium sp. IBUN TaxID=1042326 RepID=UPI000418326F|nr:biotin/lipoyl-binding protein [Rhizobium sp. IBUN]